MIDRRVQRGGLLRGPSEHPPPRHDSSHPGLWQSSRQRSRECLLSLLFCLGAMPLQCDRGGVFGLYFCDGGSLNRGAECLCNPTCIAINPICIAIPFVLQSHSYCNTTCIAIRIAMQVVLQYEWDCNTNGIAIQMGLIAIQVGLQRHSAPRLREPPSQK